MEKAVRKVRRAEMRTFPLEAQRKYMRIPFREHGRGFDGCDCGGLVWLVYKTELDIELPDWRRYYMTTHLESASELAGTIETMLGTLCHEVPQGQEIRPYDVVSFDIMGVPIHVGVAVDASHFLHIIEGYSNVRQERFSGVSWSRRINGVFRYDI